jgi:hypothetical protein
MVGFEGTSAEENQVRSECGAGEGLYIIQELDKAMPNQPD